jgi:hypothetical protein
MTTQPIEDACVVKFSTWPPTGTTITNEGSAGAGYNGTAADNDYALQSTGATSFVFNDTTDIVQVPHGTPVDNLGAHTWEFGFYLPAVPANKYLWFKGFYAAPYYALIGAAGSNKLTISRYQSAGNYEAWATPTILVAGQFYDIQIAWDATNVNNTPVVKINNVAQTLTAAPLGTVTAWANDSAYNLGIFNNPAGSSALLATLYWVRLHSRVLTDWELSNNYEADKWRFFPNTPYETGCTVKYDFAQTSGNFYNEINPGTDDLVPTGSPTRSLLPSGAPDTTWDGSTQYGTATSMSLSNNLTVEVIYKPYSATGYNYGFFGQFLSGTGGFLVVHSTGGGCAIYIADISTNITTNIIDGTKYNHAAFTVSQSGSNSILTAFANGVSGVPTTKTGKLIGTTVASLLVASTPSFSTKFKGDIALIRIYNGTALTPAQVQQNWEAEKWRIYDVIVNAPTATANFNANVPKIDVHALGQTAQATFNANVPKIDVHTPGQTAIANFNANVPTIAVHLIGQTAHTNFNANVGLITVSTPGKTAEFGFTANVAIISIVTLPELILKGDTFQAVLVGDYNILTLYGDQDDET